MEQIPSHKSDKFDSLSLYVACNGNNLGQKENAYRVLWQYLFRIAWHMTRDLPGSEAIAQDAAQKALIRIHEKLSDCKEPQAFRAWSKRITVNLVIDELRRRKRLLPLPDESEGDVVNNAIQSREFPDEEAIESVMTKNLRQLLRQAPISQRSRRVVLGRYFDDAPDELLAKIESQLTDKTVLPSHIQVTRAKNIAKLRGWDRLSAFFD